MRTPQNMPRRLPRSTRRFRITILIVIVALIILVASLRGLAGFWTDYLWFQSVGFTSVFRGVLLTKLLLALVFIGLFFAMMLGNLLIADRFAPEDVDPAQANALVVRYRDYVFPRARWVRVGVSVVFALLAGWGASREWNNWDLFHYHVSFGVKDPQYHRDVGFYVFQLPFIKFLIGWFFEALVVVLIVTIVAHYLNGGILPQASAKRSTTAVKIHLSVLLGILALIKAVDYYFQRLELVLSAVSHRQRRHRDQRSCRQTGADPLDCHRGDRRRALSVQHPPEGVDAARRRRRAVGARLSNRRGRLSGAVPVPSG